MNFSASPPNGSEPLERGAIIIPAENAPPTYLVVLLHGYGADAASFEDIAHAFSPHMPDSEFLVPDGFHPVDGGYDGRQWFSLADVTDENRPPRVHAAGAEVSEWLDQELNRRGLAGDRLIVIGFSQGASVAAYLAVHRTPSPAAVVILSGRVARDPAALPVSPPRDVFVAHGELDAVIPVSAAEVNVRLLESWGARVTARVYPDLAHGISDDEIADAQDFLRRVLT